jgi:pimeloyl-ACP methyl ester carboxylesterase
MAAVAIAKLVGCAEQEQRAGAGEKHAAPVAAAPPVSTGYVTAADGTRLFYRKVGDGPQNVILPADLFLHPAFDRLAPGRTLVYYDMRNRGQSDSVGTDRELSIQQDVVDLEAVRAHLGVESVDLVGFSYLGLMVALYAREHPQHVRRLVQLGPVPLQLGKEYPPGLRAGDYYAALDSTALADLRRLQAENYPTTHPQEYCEREGAVTRVALVGNPANVWRLNEDICTKPNEWPVRLVGHFSRHFTSVQALALEPSTFAQVAQPVLTVHGALDRNAAYGGGRDWAMTFPNARLVTVEGGAHCAWADDPDLVFNAIDTFLNGAWPDVAEHVTQLERPTTPAH